MREIKKKKKELFGLCVGGGADCGVVVTCREINSNYISKITLFQTTSIIVAVVGNSLLFPTIALASLLRDWSRNRNGTG